MAYRIRSVRPDVYSRPSFDTASLLAQFVYLALANLTDDAGRGNYQPRSIAAFIFPAKEEVDVAPALAELVDLGLLHRYEVDGRSYYHYDEATWLGDQKPNRPQPSKLPAPAQYCDACKAARKTEVKPTSVFTPDSVNNEPKFTENSSPDHLMEGSGGEMEGRGAAPLDMPAHEAAPPSSTPRPKRYPSKAHEFIDQAIREDLFEGELDRLELAYFAGGGGSFLQLQMAKAYELEGYLRHPRERRQQAWAFAEAADWVRAPYAVVVDALTKPDKYPEAWGAERPRSSSKIRTLRPEPQPATTMTEADKRARYVL